VRRLLDRERKWLVRGTLDGRKKRAYKYRAARERLAQRRDAISSLVPLRAPPK
jgi:hypothetical protein